MHQLAQRTVREALAKGAQIDSVDHFSDLVALDRAAKGHEKRIDSEYYDALDQPIILGRGKRAAVLYSPSYAALEWIAERANAWFDDKQYTLAIAWALSHGRNSEALQTAGSRWTVTLKVLLWARTRNCSAAALCEAASDLVRRDTGDSDRESGEAGEEPPSNAVGRMLIRLLDELGENEDYWLYGPVSRLNIAIEYLREKDRAEARARAAANGKAVARDPDDPDVQDFRAWRKASDAFLAKFAPEETKEIAHV